MVTVRGASIAFRFDPEVKQALAFIAEREGRSMANMMEWLVRKHCQREGLGWPHADLPWQEAHPQAIGLKAAAKPNAPRNVLRAKQAPDLR
jgi:hypothetical protein